MRRKLYVAIIVSLAMAFTLFSMHLLETSATAADIKVSLDASSTRPLTRGQEEQTLEYTAAVTNTEPKQFRFGLRFKCPEEIVCPWENNILDLVKEVYSTDGNTSPLTLDGSIDIPATAKAGKYQLIAYIQEEREGVWEETTQAEVDVIMQYSQYDEPVLPEDLCPDKVCPPIGCPMAHCDERMSDGVNLSPPMDSVTMKYIEEDSIDCGSDWGIGCSGNGTIVACSFARDNKPIVVYEYNAEEEKVKRKWTSENMGIYFNSSAASSAPIVTASGEVIACDNKQICRFDSDGIEKWCTQFNAEWYTSPRKSVPLSPVIIKNGIIILATNRGPVYAIDSRDGAVLGKLYIYEDPENPEKGYFVTQNTPAVDGNRIYISTEHSKDPKRARLVAVDVMIDDNEQRVAAELTEAWHYEFGGPSGASPLRIGDTIYFDGDTGKRGNISGPQINDDGQVVWYSYDGTNYDVFFYNGGEPIPSPDPNDDVDPQINQDGYLVWCKEVWCGDACKEYEIFFYNTKDGNPMQLSQDFYDFPADYVGHRVLSNFAPRINNKNQVVWYGYDSTDGDYDIFAWSGKDGVEKQIIPTLNNCDDVTPQINDNGQVVWCRHDGTDSEIFLWNIDRPQDPPIKLSTTSQNNFAPQINNQDQVVWCGYNGTDYEIFFYDTNNGNLMQLSEDSYDDYDDIPNHRIQNNFAPQINDNGQVVWYGYDSTDGDYDVFVWNGGQTIHTLNDYDDVTPQISDNGQVVWCRHNGTDSEIFLLDITNLDTNPAPKPIELSTNSVYNFAPQINDNGQVVWCGYDPQSKKLNIYLYNGSGADAAAIQGSSWQAGGSPTLFAVKDLGPACLELWTHRAFSRILASFAEDPRYGFWYFPFETEFLVHRAKDGSLVQAIQLGKIMDETHDDDAENPMVEGDAQAVSVGHKYNNDGYVVSSYAYVVGYSGLRVIDIDPASENYRTEVGSVDATGYARRDIDVVEGTHACVVYDNMPAYRSVLQVIDISDPANPSIVGSCYLEPNAQSVSVGYTYDNPGKVEGYYAYVACGYSGLQVIDISDSANPGIVGACDTPDYARDVYAAGTYAYVACGYSGLQVIDIHPSSENYLEIVGACDTPGHARDVYAAGAYAYVADGDSGLQVIEITDPANPRIVGSCDALEDDAQGVRGGGSYAYVAAGEAGLQVIDIPDEYCPSSVISIAGSKTVPIMIVSAKGPRNYEGPPKISRCTDLQNFRYDGAWVVAINLATEELLWKSKITDDERYITYGQFPIIEDSSGNARILFTNCNNGTYYIEYDTTAPTVEADPSGDNAPYYIQDQSVTVTLAANEPANIYYTTDGSDPTTGSRLYRVPIKIDRTTVPTVLKFIAVDAAGNTSEVVEKIYDISYGGSISQEVALELPAGWSMISLPIRPEVATVKAVFPEAVVMYKYEKDMGYVRVKKGEDLEVGMGYWILFDNPQSYVIKGTAITEYTIPAEKGWYMIGGCTLPAQTMVTSGKIDVIYGYTQGRGYERLLESETLEQGKGYWILFSNTPEGAAFTARGTGGGT